MRGSFLPYRSLLERPRPVDPFALRVTRVAPDNTRGDYVLYHCFAARRMHRNLALDYAVMKAHELRLPLTVVETSEPDASPRLQAFVRHGVAANRRDALARGLGYELADSTRELAKRARLVVADEHPTMPRSADAHVLVDGNGLLPMRAFEKEQYSAKFLRDRAHRMIPELWALSGSSRAEARPTSTSGGRDAALAKLDALDLHDYTSHRHPGSGLSPYLHFGYVGIHEVAERALFTAVGSDDDVDAFLEQAVIRRELSFNLCFYNANYGSLAALPEWARKTLDAHRRDRRKPLYTADELEAAETHDEVWNLAQRQLVESGTMHGYLRMLWGKKALEWMATPEEAHAFLIEQHAKYALDGRDPSTHAGVLWCFGKHDRPWAPERPIFGVIRYMSSESTRRKLGLRV